MKTFTIEPTPSAIEPDLRHKIDMKTKPPGSLGKLETLALKIGKIQNTLSPELKNPCLFVFAGDHGVAKEGVSAFPQEVTYQMVLNFLNGGAAINVFCRQNSIAIKVVDAGVIGEFEPHPDLINAKVAQGTKSYTSGPAMTAEECGKAIAKGAELVETQMPEGANVISFGEMGIGNTSSASLLMSSLLNIPLADCIGPGTGLDTEGMKRKTAILSKALEANKTDGEPYSVLAAFGGFEIAMMTGAMLSAAEKKMLLLIDGFIATSAFLTAWKIAPAILDYAVFCHVSEEYGHKKMIAAMGGDPLLSLGMRLGEGTGAAVAYPVVQAAVTFLNEMASFESAGVSNKD